MLKLYTDGSSIRNGRSGARAGYSVVFPSYLHLSWGDFMGEATNQAAELRAIYEGVVAGKTIQGNPAELTLRIMTDSEFSIKCLTVWIVGWKKKKWLTAEGRPVVHRVIIEKILEELKAYSSYLFVHVKAHTGGSDEDSKWNAVADDLAHRAAESGIRTTCEAPPERGETSANVVGTIPLALVGSPVSHDTLIESIKENLDQLDAAALNSALLSALKKTLSLKGYDLESSKVAKTVHYRLVEKKRIIIERLDGNTTDDNSVYVQ
jgi:ribonuclease HI